MNYDHPLCVQLRAHGFDSFLQRTFHFHGSSHTSVTDYQTEDCSTPGQAYAISYATPLILGIYNSRSRRNCHTNIAAYWWEDYSILEKAFAHPTRGRLSLDCLA
jgi:hypothetical protein